LEQRKRGHIRQTTSKKGSIHMQFSMAGKEKDDLLIQMTA